MTEKTVVSERGDGVSSQGHYGGGFAGGAAKEDISGKHPKRYREQTRKIVRETGKIQVDR